MNDVLEYAKNELTTGGRNIINMLYSELKIIMELVVKATQEIEMVAKKTMLVNDW